MKCSVTGSIKYSLYILFVLVLFLSQITLSAEKSVKMVEGLFYLDETPVSVEIKDGKISRIVRKNNLDDPKNVNVYIAPGLFDNQVNGYAGVSFSFGKSNLTTEGVLKATQALWQDGVTTYLPTLTTNSQEILLNNFAIFGKAIENPEIRGSIPGFHL